MGCRCHVYATSQCQAVTAFRWLRSSALVLISQARACTHTGTETYTCV